MDANRQVRSFAPPPLPPIPLLSSPIDLIRAMTLLVMYINRKSIFTKFATLRCVQLFVVYLRFARRPNLGQIDFSSAILVSCDEFMPTDFLQV